MNDFEKQFEQIVAGLNIDDRPSAEHKRTLRQQMLAAGKTDASDKTALRIQPVWSKIMKSNITKSAAAAILIIAVFIGINMLNGTPAWADVLEQVKKAKSVYYKCTSQVDDFSWTNEIMINQEGVQRHILNNGGNIQIFDFRNGIELQLNTHKKTAYRTTHTPKPFMRLFNSLDFLVSRHEKGNISFVEHEVIDGIETEVYEDVQPLQHSVTTIWISSKTKLPVRVVSEETPPMDSKYFPIKDITINSKDFGCDDYRSLSGILSGSCTPQYRKQIMTDFKWNVDLEPEFFSTEIPPDYEHREQILSKPSEKDLIEVLHFWAEMSDGLFPSDVNNLMDPDIMEPMIIEKFKKGIDPKQKYEDAADFMNTVRRAASFVEKKIVVEDNWNVSNEPVLFGEGDKPLYWWKLEDSEMYRVIFGDLTIENIAPENLPR